MTLPKVHILVVSWLADVTLCSSIKPKATVLSHCSVIIDCHVCYLFFFFLKTRFFMSHSTLYQLALHVTF